MSFEKDIITRIVKAIIGVAALIIGGLIYIRYRSENLLMFDWYHDLGLTDYIESFRKNADTLSVYGWFKYNMPAGLWLFAYMFIIDSVWGKEKNNTKKVYLYALPVVAIVSEIMQYVSILPGTFDIMDLLCYALAILIFTIINISHVWKLKVFYHL